MEEQICNPWPFALHTQGSQGTRMYFAGNLPWCSTRRRIFFLFVRRQIQRNPWTSVDACVSRVSDPGPFPGAVRALHSRLCSTIFNHCSRRLDASNVDDSGSVHVLIPPLFVLDGHREHCLPRLGGVVIRRAACGPRRLRDPARPSGATARTARNASARQRHRRRMAGS